MVKKITPSVVRSPSEAAIGVATLSGLILKRREARTTADIKRDKISEAEQAVASEDAHRRVA